MATTKVISLAIRPTSSVTKQGAIDYALSRANTRDSEDETGELAHFYQITDSRNGAFYQVYGDKAQDALQVPLLIDIFDPNLYIKGYVDEVVIDSYAGTATIELPNDTDSYNVNAQVLNSSYAELRIEDKTSSSFKIVLYDSRGWEEDETKLDCTTDNVSVSFTVIYK